MRVLVTDGDQRSALAVTRALGKQHVQVIVGAETTSSLAAASRYCSRSFVYPSPYADPEGFVSRLLELVQHDHITALFPISDVAMRVIGAEKQQFEQYTAVPVPPMSVFEEISDKYRLMKLALELQVPIPETIFIPNGYVKEVIDGISRFPVVVKPGCSLVKKNGQWFKTSVHFAASAEELFRLYREIDYLQQPSLIQQRVAGEGQGLFVLMDHGEPVTLFAHRRLRERPPSGGVSVLRESIELPKPMTDYAFRLLQHVGWHGVAMVEFKIDRQSNVPLLMEVNGRFWGSLQLALDSGLNFPYLLYQTATGQRVRMPTNDYRIGVKSRWLLGDLDHLLLRLSRSKQALYLPPNSSSKRQCMLDFCRFFQPNMYYEIERMDDPGPSVYEVQNYLRNFLRIGMIADGMQQLAGTVRMTLRSLSQLTVKLYDSLRFSELRQLWGSEPSLPQCIQSVLFVCKGNVCRSPLAEVYMKAELQRQGCKIRVRSAGLETSLGKPAHPLATLVGQQEGLCLDAHCTQPLLRELVDKADLILVMERTQRYKLLKLHPQAKEKVFVLSHFDDQASPDIADPYDGTLDDFRRCFGAIRQSCDKLLLRLMNV